MQSNLLIEKIENGEYNEKLKRLYGDAKAQSARRRCIGALENFNALYGGGDVEIISVPGRSEVLGNHTDHNRGRVLAAAINLDVIAVVAKSLAPRIRIKSEGFEADDIGITDLAARESEKFTSAAIIRGICGRFAEAGHQIGGFDAYTTSDVQKGSGLSSSAAFEVMVGFILNRQYNNGRISALEIARIGQYAENNYFGKPCGLMDQTACSTGGFISIDFRDLANPVVEKLDFDLSKSGYSLCIVSTGGSHHSQNDEYAAMPNEMKQIAAHFGKDVLREVDRAAFAENIGELRKRCGDRAVLRAMHYFAENARVHAGAEALKEGNFEGFLRLVASSGNSSYKYLQNVYDPSTPKDQGLALALAVSEEALAKIPAAVRVHGGGFSGTIQAFVPKKHVDGYFKKIGGVFGEGACLELSVRNEGAAAVM
ncbi:MAG: galactokinase [Oscillospiraceae bacterium]|nr:galactokinase [Oscillospiraceae bacterium]